MTVFKTNIFPEILLFEPTVFYDDRGCFFESHNQTIADALNVTFQQENHSISKKNVVRGLHYQWDNPTGKLCRVVKGAIIDYVVDIRKGSKTYGKYDSFELSEENKQILWVPPGFAHGFLSLVDDTHLLYKCTELYHKAGEGSINPFDQTLALNFPIPVESAILSEKDREAQSFLQYTNNPKF